MIKPIQPTWEQRLSEWEKEEYKGKTFAENIPVITTAKGERVRSKSEKILADYFYHTGIPYKYEHPVILKRFGIVYPDFTFLSPILSMQEKRSRRLKHTKKMESFQGKG